MFNNKIIDFETFEDDPVDNSDFKIDFDSKTDFDSKIDFDLSSNNSSDNDSDRISSKLNLDDGLDSELDKDDDLDKIFKHGDLNIHNNIFYINYEDIDLNKIKVIEGKFDKDRDCKYFSIKYRFNKVEKDLVILFKDVKLDQSSYRIINSLKYSFLPINSEDDNGFSKKIDEIRNHIMNQIKKIVRVRKLSLNKNDVSLKYYGKQTPILKLGMANENYKNKNQKLKEFENTLTNYRYNKINSDRYYLSSILISFNVVHYDLSKRFTNVSIKPCSRTIEYRFVKQSYKSTIHSSERNTTPVKSIVSF